MNLKLFLILAFLLILFHAVRARSVKVENSILFREEVKKLNPGDTFVLASQDKADHWVGLWGKKAHLFKTIRIQPN